MSGLYGLLWRREILTNENINVVVFCALRESGL
jgi:hypothetical protein